jgi:multidrug transporter EmrE-like cation transporter
MLSGKSLVFLLLTVACTVTGQVLLKKGSSAGGSISLASVLKNPLIVLGCLSYVTSLFFWLNTLKLLPLSVAYPSASVSYVLVILASALFLNEPLSLNKVAGVLLICGGVFFIGRG